ncbi:uncharacterized protein GGS22DRAFT_178930 [Annulohypoxylon maeteangense]|uniref:uncharacterized protein n=1 Tax=Annulohypoxylon maeteangense TaxID=1927788 RepID=UPI002008E69E|nr:uncharacterized protein GGS22DRAFT_178930 [Annulohypoxylon maeteangense]KAI0886957.1 hypothetical protein GGS22DRAFT_178930 [Annulohypoxylon maeteangense]
MSGTMRGTPSRGQNRGGRDPFGGAASPANSNIPRPVLDAHGNSHQPSPSDAASGISASRQKQSKRDEAIRKKLESDLSKKKHLTGRARHSRKAPPGTVLALKPSPALQIKPLTTVAEAAQLMAAKREDCVLVTDDDDRIAGIFTAKDLAFRVVGAGQKANNVTIAEIMTTNPLCARTDTSATEALDLMVRRGFRHLPVMDENQDISGILDITKCFYDAMEKLERAYASSTKLYAALEGVQSELGTSQPQQIIQYVEALRSKMSGPTLESVLNGTPPTTVSVRTTVKEAAALMKDNRTTAVLVQDQGQITGIFTSKDVVLRVIAPGLDPATCSVVRVMTPHPDFAPMDMSIQAALRKMHDGHYLNLPVMNDQGEIVGMVDVLKLTYATLEQINTMGTSGDSEGPAWNKFWLSLDNETESMVSGDGSHHHGGTMVSRSILSPDAQRERMNEMVAPGDSASHVGMESSPVHSSLAHQQPGDAPFAFKFKAPSGRVHRLQIIASEGIEQFVENVLGKLGSEVEAIGGAPVVEDGRLSPGGFAMSYLDDEGDTVSITTDQDLLEAVLLARHHHREKVDLFVHDPEKPPVAATQPDVSAITPAASSAPSDVRRRRHVQDDDEEYESDEDYATARRRKRSSAYIEPEQVIAGVPNELLLPGAIVALAVVIVGVFTISRATSRFVELHDIAAIVITMIIRDLGVRHARKALATPLRQAYLRRLSTEDTSSSSPTGITGVSDADLAAAAAAFEIKAPQPPSIFTASARASRRKKPIVSDTIVEDYKVAQELRSKIGRLGAYVKRTYRPNDVFNNPPGPKDVTLELLMASQAHMGHHASLWNPANARYIYGIRQGIHIISLEQTAAHLRRAARVVEEVAYHGGLILFVGTRQGQMQIVTQAARLAGACHLFTKWTPGSITNSEVILNGLEMQILDENDEPVVGFERHLQDRRPLIPDLVVCLNPLENYVLLHECALVNVPTIGVIDTNTEPTWVTYGIPANDDSLRCLSVIGSVLGRAGETGQKRRKQDAKRGIVSWTTPLDVVKFMRAEEKYGSGMKETEKPAVDPITPESTPF